MELPVFFKSLSLSPTKVCSWRQNVLD